MTRQPQFNNFFSIILCPSRKTLSLRWEYHEEKMKLTINGESRELPEGISLDELILQLGIKKEAVVAEVNRHIVQPQERGKRKLSEGDQIELIQFVGGG
jgi:sulfur carrier protein